MGCPAETWDWPAEEAAPYLPARPRRHLFLVREAPSRPILPQAAIARVQSPSKGDTAGVAASSVAATWGSTTTAGSLLVAIVLTRAIGTNTPTFTAPAGWVAAPPSRAGATGGSNQDPSCQIWYIANSAARSGSESFSWTGSAEAILYLSEYSGVATSSPYDTEGNDASSTTSSTAATGTTGALTAANSLCIAGIAVKNQSRTLTTPQNGYTLIRTDATTDATNANGIATGLLELIGGTGGATTTTALTVSVASQHTGVLAVFKPAAGGASVTGSAALTGTGSLAASGIRKRLGTAALTGSGALAAAGVRKRFAAAALSGSGALAATGTRTRFGAAALTGAGSLTAAGARTRFGGAALTAAGTLAATGTRTRFGAADMLGLGTLTVAGVRTRFGAAALTGVGTLSATALDLSAPVVAFFDPPSPAAATYRGVPVAASFDSPTPTLERV